MIRHMAGVAEIVEDLEAASLYYPEALGLAVEPMEGGGYANVKIGGVLHFGLWERTHAARAMSVPVDEVPLGFSVGFEVDEVGAAHRALGERGARLVQGPQDEPWGQRTARFLSPSGMLCEVSESPWARRIDGRSTS
jgi:catechol 2,3-dioxygenase-like lactoylglutathione lyase family enzyme